MLLLGLVLGCPTAPESDVAAVDEASAAVVRAPQPLPPRYATPLPSDPSALDWRELPPPDWLGLDACFHPATGEQAWRAALEALTLTPDSPGAVWAAYDPWLPSCRTEAWCGWAEDTVAAIGPGPLGPLVSRAAHCELPRAGLTDAQLVDLAAERHRESPQRHDPELAATVARMASGDVWTLRWAAQTLGEVNDPATAASLLDLRDRLAPSRRWVAERALYAQFWPEAQRVFQAYCGGAPSDDACSSPVALVPLPQRVWRVPADVAVQDPELELAWLVDAYGHDATVSALQRCVSAGNQDPWVSDLCLHRLAYLDRPAALLLAVPGLDVEAAVALRAWPDAGAVLDGLGALADPSGPVGADPADTLVLQDRAVGLSPYSMGTLELAYVVAARAGLDEARFDVAIAPDGRQLGRLHGWLGGQQWTVEADTWYADPAAVARLVDAMARDLERPVGVLAAAWLDGAAVVVAAPDVLAVAADGGVLAPLTPAWWADYLPAEGR